MEPNMRIIKKYPNRRLYDTETSQYITLDAVKDLVLKNIKFKVVDVTTEEDMTNYVLLQIINENESGHSPIFTAEFLQNIIRFYGNPLQNMMSQFLEKSFSSFAERKANVGDYFQNIMGKDNPFNKMADLAKQNMAMWTKAQEAAKNTANQAESSTKTKAKPSSQAKPKSKPSAASKKPKSKPSAKK